MRFISQMKSPALLFAPFLFCIFTMSCNKDPKLSEREQQELEEGTAVLLPNEIIEQEGIRFVLNYLPENADISLSLFKGTGNELTPITLSQEQPFVNYSILTSSLPENSEFTIRAEFPSVTSNGTFELAVIGFTNLNTSKRFTVSNIPFTTSGQGTTKSVLRIRKGLNKYSFYSIQ